MRWIVRKKGEKWAVFLEQKYCKTSESVCYGVARTEVIADRTASRLNDEWKEKTS